eukprot:gene19144-21246_t
MWFNGGPPCSALLGAFTELGPFRTSDIVVVFIEGTSTICMSFVRRGWCI